MRNDRRMINKARNRIESTLDVTSFIVKHQMMWLYLKSKLTKPELQEYRQNKFFDLNVDSQGFESSDLEFETNKSQSFSSHAL